MPSLPARADLASSRPEDLLALYATIVDELLDRGIVRSTNNPVADYSEHLTAEAFDLKLVANSATGYDAISKDGVRYQVKARRLTARTASRQLGFIRGFDAEEPPFDVLVGILFETDFRVQRAALVPVGVVRERVKRVDYVNAWRLILNDAIWLVPGVEDVTDRIRAVTDVGRKVSRAPVPESALATSTGAIDAIWAAALERYVPGRVLLTRARKRPFTVAAASDHLVITPESGSGRPIFAAEFERAAPLVDVGSRGTLVGVTFNSSYLEAILDDLRDGHAAEVAVATAGSEWTAGEIEIVVEDYLDMLRTELDGASYRKADHWRALLSRLPGRTKGSIERKHQNVSAVLVERGLRFINGYKPLGNYQRALAEEVDRRLAADESLSSRLALRGASGPLHHGESMREDMPS